MRLIFQTEDAPGKQDDQTLAALEGYQLLRTDLNGWIEVRTDGEKLYVEMERQEYRIRHLTLTQRKDICTISTRSNVQDEQNYSNFGSTSKPT